MVTLANYPNYSQLSAKINGPNDCVPTSIKDGVKYLTGEELDLDAMVTAVYGPNYHGFTSARAFVPYIAQHGVKLFPIDGDNATLVQALHQQIQLLHPCLLTEPDPYAPLHPDWSHVLSVYREDPGTLTARDPYSTHDVTHTDTEWQSLLEFREVWAMESLHPTQSQGDLPMLQLSDPMGKFFTQVSDTHWHCNSNNVDLIYGHLSFYRQYQGIFGLPRTNEIYLAPLPGTAIVVYERAYAIYDPGRVAKNEAPPGAGQVYLMHIDGGGTGIALQQIAKPLLATLQAEVSQLQAQLANGPSVQLQAQVASYQAAIKQVDEIVHALVTA